MKWVLEGPWKWVGLEGLEGLEVQAGPEGLEEGRRKRVKEEEELEATLPLATPLRPETLVLM